MHLQKKFTSLAVQVNNSVDINIQQRNFFFYSTRAQEYGTCQDMVSLAISFVFNVLHKSWIFMVLGRKVYGICGY